MRLHPVVEPMLSVFPALRRRCAQPLTTYQIDVATFGPASAESQYGSKVGAIPPWRCDFEGILCGHSIHARPKVACWERLPHDVPKANG